MEPIVSARLILDYISDHRSIAFQMSVDLDSSNFYLVADTSVLIRSLPMVRAVIESSQSYTVYIPYVVLTELDQGSTAAPVNKLLCRHMKQKSPRVIAQSVIGHKEVTQATGVAQKNDDLILGAALKLKETGEYIVVPYSQILTCLMSCDVAPRPLCLLPRASHSAFSYSVTDCRS